MLTLGLGIGATTAVLTLIQGVLLTPPPYRQPEQLMRSSPLRPRMDRKALECGSGLLAYGWTGRNRPRHSMGLPATPRKGFTFLIRQEGGESLEGMYVSTNFFDVTGLRPLLGRTFLPTRGHGRWSAVSDRLRCWQRSFLWRPQSDRHHREDQPSAGSVHHRGCHASGNPLPSIAQSCQRAELR